MNLTWKWLLSSLRPHARVSREDVIRAPDVGHLLCECRPPTSTFVENCRRSSRQRRRPRRPRRRTPPMNALLTTRTTLCRARRRRNDRDDKCRATVNRRWRLGTRSKRRTDDDGNNKTRALC